MQLLCPMCSTTITTSPPKAGRYTPKCPNCEKPFVITITVQTVAEYKSANRIASPSSMMKHDPEATFTTLANGPIEQDAESTFAPQIPAASVSLPQVNPDATFASQASSHPVIHDPDSTFASQIMKPNADPDQIEATVGFLPYAQANNLAHNTDAVAVSDEIKSVRISLNRTVLTVVIGVLLATLSVPTLHLLGVNIQDFGPLKPTHLFAILGIVTGTLGFFLLCRK